MVTVQLSCYYQQENGKQLLGYIEWINCLKTLVESVVKSVSKSKVIKIEVAGDNVLLDWQLPFGLEYRPDLLVSVSNEWHCTLKKIFNETEN